MFGQHQNNVPRRPFKGIALRENLDALEGPLGDLAPRSRGLDNQRAWMEWREKPMDENELLETSGLFADYGLRPEYGLPPPGIGHSAFGLKNGLGARNRRPRRGDTPAKQPNGILKSFGGNLQRRNAQVAQRPLRAGRRTPGDLVRRTGHRPGAHRRNGSRLPRRFEDFIWDALVRGGFPQDAMQYYLQELTDHDEPGSSEPNSLEHILRDEAITLEFGQPREEWAPKRLLGKGGFGDVMLWQRRRNESTVDQLAVKNAKYDDFFLDYSSEAHLTRRLNVAGCNNVVQVYDWAALERERRVRIIYAFYPLGDLSRTLDFYLEHSLVFPEMFLWHIFYNIATALCYCARGSIGPDPKEGWEEVVHCDLKPPNILMDSPDPKVNPFYPNLRLADFGLAYTVPNMMIRDFKMRNGSGGTPGYLAPEMDPELRPGVAYPFPGSHSDVHSLGDMMKEFMGCVRLRYPSHALPLLKEAVVEGWGYEYWPYSKELTHLVQECRATDGRDRPTAYKLYMTTKRMSERMLGSQMAVERQAQAGSDGRGLSSATVLYTTELQREYTQSDTFRDSYTRSTDWFYQHADEVADFCDAALNPRPPPPGYVAIGNGLKFEHIPDYVDPQEDRPLTAPGPHESDVSLNDQQGEAQPADVPAAGEALEDGPQARGFKGMLKGFFSLFRWTGR